MRRMHQTIDGRMVYEKMYNMHDDVQMVFQRVEQLPIQHEPANPRKTAFQLKRECWQCSYNSSGWEGAQDLVHILNQKSNHFNSFHDTFSHFLQR